jgi:anaerobic selenocysteine-containing dehydrogenase
MTNHWVDIKNADLVMVMGGNAAEAHPCGFKWAIEAKKERKAKLIVVDPRFTRSAAVSDFYAPVRAGSDIAFLGGVINYLLSNDKIHHDYVRNYTNAAFLINPDFKFDGGLSPATTRRSATTTRHLELPDRGQGRLRHGRPDHAGSELRAAADEEALQPLHAGNGEQGLRHAEGVLPQDLRNDGGDGGAGQDHDDLVCAGLDAAFASVRRTSVPWR